MRSLEQQKKSLSPTANLLLLFLTLILALAVSITSGRYPIHFSELIGILASRLLPIEPFWEPVQESLLLQHRLPRILMSCMVGSCLAAAGTTYQVIFQNPMAAPDLLGASSGAALGAAFAILSGMTRNGITLLSFLFGLITVTLVTLIADRSQVRGTMSLILSGIMMSSLISSTTSCIKLAADPNDQLPAITYWLMGSLNGILPEDVLVFFFPMASGLLILFLLRWQINLLSLGEEQAQTMGINAARLRTLSVLSATLITAASVAVSGMIGWAGLIVPHFARRMVGSNYRHLLPASMLSGALFLLLSDNLARNLLEIEIPIGILTSFVGAPFFLFLLLKNQKSCQ